MRRIVLEFEWRGLRMGAYRFYINVLDWHVALFRRNVYPLGGQGWRHVVGDVWIHRR